jgi:hypothetical protein
VTWWLVRLRDSVKKEERVFHYCVASRYIMNVYKAHFALVDLLNWRGSLGGSAGVLSPRYSGQSFCFNTWWDLRLGAFLREGVRPFACLGELW